MRAPGTEDPEIADFFYVPVYAACLVFDNFSRFPLYRRIVSEALKYIIFNFPHWNRTHGQVARVTAEVEAGRFTARAPPAHAGPCLGFRARLRRVPLVAGCAFARVAAVCSFCFVGERSCSCVHLDCCIFEWIAACVFVV